MNVWPSFPHLNEDSWIQIKKQPAAWKPPHRLTDRAILSYLRHWLLDDYVLPYCLKLETSRIFRRCYWIDTLDHYHKQDLASINKSRSSDIITHTPALDTIFSLQQKLEKDAAAVKLHGLILVKNRGKKSYTDLKSSEAEQIVPANGLIQASWQEMGKPILQAIEQSPAILLLDPLQPQLYSSKDLQPLYQRTMPTEICLVILHKYIGQQLRIAGNDQKEANALSNLLRSTQWKQLSSESSKQTQNRIPNETITGFIDLMIASMRPYFQTPPITISFPLISGPATLSNAPLTLLYATRKPENLLTMNDAIYSYQHRIYRKSYQHVLGKEWFEEQETIHREKKLDQLSRQIQQAGKTTRIRRWPDLRQQLVLTQFGQFTQEDYDHIIGKLIATQQVRCQWRQNPAVQEKELTPGIHDILIWP